MRVKDLVRQMRGATKNNVDVYYHKGYFIPKEYERPYIERVVIAEEDNKRFLQARDITEDESISVNRLVEFLETLDGNDRAQIQLEDRDKTTEIEGFRIDFDNDVVIYGEENE